jgi:solute:Na+ symporter, SSS family
MAARNSQGLVSMTLSYFVSGIGAWVIFAAPQAAVIGGWPALVGYAVSTVVPLLLFGLIAPPMRNQLPKGFTLNEYVYGRFGTPCTVYFAFVSMFYMVLYLAAELSSASALATGLSLITVQGSTWWQNENVFLPTAVSPIVGMSVITLFYTVIGGLPVSIVTDRVQGVGVLVLTILVTIAAYAEAGVGDQASWDEVVGHGISPVYVPTDYGNSFAVAISLIIGVTCANLVHAGYWQRIWAAESNRTVVHATYYSSALTIVIMILVGITGWIAYSHFVILMSPNVPGGDLSFLSVPWLINTFMGEGWAVVVMILGISMIASTCDTLQSGMTALLWPFAKLCFPNGSDIFQLSFVVFLTVLFNVPPVLLALSGQSILQLFLLADLLAAGVVAPLFMGVFWKKCHPIGALAGSVGGLLTTLIVYAIGEAWGEGFAILVSQGGIFRRVATYAFCITPVASGLITAAVSSIFFPAYEFAGYKNAAAEGGSGTARGQVTTPEVQIAVSAATASSV